VRVVATSRLAGDRALCLSCARSEGVLAPDADSLSMRSAPVRAPASAPAAASAQADMFARPVASVEPRTADDVRSWDRLAASVRARDAAKKRRMLKQLEADLDAEKQKRNQQIKELQREIDTHDRELDTEQQERVVLCDEIFRAGTVYVRRSDTLEEFEPRPATAQEAQRYLPAVESTLHTLPSSAPLLDQAAAAQGAATDDVVDQDDEPEDDGLSEPSEKPARRARGKGKGK
jgi:hypothetical protein